MADETPPEITARLQTYSLLDNKPAAFRVSWIMWDSGFRATGLAIGDEIVAVNGKPIVKPADESDVQKMLPKCVGQYAEAQFWAEAGAHEGDIVALTVRRRRVGDAGWDTHEFKAPLRRQQFYLDPNGRRMFSPDGPPRDEYDGFDGTWDYWYGEALVPKLGYLQEDWQRNFTSRLELQQLLTHQARIDFLAQHYPGTFAQTVKTDWEQARDALLGPKIELTPQDLDFRRAEDERVQHITDLAKQAWDAAQQAHAADTIPLFPAIDPIHGDRKSVIGKYVVLPPIENRDWIAEPGRNFLAAGSADNGWYFADAETDAAMRMLRARGRYQRLVSPNIPETYTILGRILPDPRILVIDGRGVFGMQFTPVAALVGEQMFVDLTQQADGESAFAGEDTFHIPQAAAPAPDATPAQVMTAMITAIKAGDQTTWDGLFARWWVSTTDDGHPLINPRASYRGNDDWELSRRLILDKVVDIRVAWTNDPHDVIAADAFPGSPHVEEVEVELQHIGSFDGEYRPFQDVTVNRIWRLQRADGGPWRIITSQSA